MRGKKWLALALALCMVLGLAPAARAGDIDVTTDVPEPGFIIGVEVNLEDGTQEYPYLIQDYQDFDYFINEVRKGNSFQDCYFEMTTDLDLSSVCGKDIANWVPIGTFSNPFAGSFDGCGHTISGLYVDKVVTINVGLFGCNTGTVKNLTVEGNIKAGTSVGGIVGNNRGRIENCTFRGTVTSTNAQGGGIAGSSIGTIIGCRNESVVKGKPEALDPDKVCGVDIGGIVGLQNGRNSNIIDCVNVGRIKGYEDVGGIVGRTIGNVEGCRNEGLVYGSNPTTDFINNNNNGNNNGQGSGQEEDEEEKKKDPDDELTDLEIYNAGNRFASFVGGIAGTAHQRVVGCENYGGVLGNEFVAGIAGIHIPEKLDGYQTFVVLASECVNYGNVKATYYSGGIAGSTAEGTVSCCLNYGTIEMGDKRGGICGWVKRTKLTGCGNIGTVYDTRNSDAFYAAGGVVGGAADKVTFESCFNDGIVDSHARYVGGIVGYLFEESTVTRCINNENIMGRIYVGGIAGVCCCDLNTSASRFSYCGNNGDVSRYVFGDLDPHIGGIVGGALSATSLMDCYNTGTMDASDASGEFIGYGQGNLILSNCLALGSVERGGPELGIFVGHLFDDSTFWRSFSQNCALQRDNPPKYIGNRENNNFQSSEFRMISRSDYTSNAGGNYNTGWDFTNTWYMTSDGPRLRKLGGGTVDGVLTISSLAGLRVLQVNVNNGMTYEGCTVKLTENIDLSGVERWQPIGYKDDYDDYPFMGTFDGGGHTISGLTINGENCAGLFGYMGGTVKNLKVQGSVHGDQGVGGIAGSLFGSIENCAFEGSVTGNDYVGGLAGAVVYGSVTNSSFAGSVVGRATSEDTYTGGLIGMAQVSEASKCSAEGPVSGGGHVGGLIGEMATSDVSDCIHIGDVSGQGSNVGGVTGEITISGGTITNCCHCMGDVQGAFNVAGVAGAAHMQIGILSSGYGISNCYYESGRVANAYNLAQGTHTDYGFYDGYSFSGGHGQNPAGAAEPLTLAQFKVQSSFVNWDFADTWTMGADHPELIPLRAPIDFNGNGGSGSMGNSWVDFYGGSVPDNNYTLADSDFVGWNTSPDATGDWYGAGDTVYATDGMELYAIWGSRQLTSYVDANGVPQEAREAITLNDQIYGLWNDWYAVRGTVTLQNRLEVRGDVNIILCDGAVLNAPMGVHVPTDSSLTVWGQGGAHTVSGPYIQTCGTGQLNASITAAQTRDDYSHGAAIGGDDWETAGLITINGGVITATGLYGAGIGGGEEGHNSEVRINGGCVYATGGNGSAGIGGGRNGDGGYVAFDGGYTWAAGSTVMQTEYGSQNEYAAPGIGAGVPAPYVFYIMEMEDPQEEPPTEEEPQVVLPPAVVFTKEDRTISGVSIYNAYVHAEAGTGGENCYPAHAIGTSCANDYPYGSIYPLVHVKVEIEDGFVPLNQAQPACREPWIEVTPCTEHEGMEDDLGRCRWCGASNLGGAAFIIYHENYDGAPNYSDGVNVGETITVRSSPAAREGYRFLDWNSEPDGTGYTIFPGSQTELYQNLELYAQWVPMSETPFVDLNGVRHSVVASGFTGAETVLSSGWYVVNGNVTVNNRIQIQGNVNLILADGCRLTANEGIEVPLSYGLTIYGQSEKYSVPNESIQTLGTGKLIATGHNNMAGIGGGTATTGGSSGSVTVCGGVIEASGSGGAGIGGSSGMRSGPITIANGCVTAIGSDGGAGIGGGAGGAGGTVNIYDGYVNVKGGSYSGIYAAAGIGAGCPMMTFSNLSSGNVNINGGVVVAEAGTTFDSEYAAQAIGVNLHDANYEGNGLPNTLTLEKHMRVIAGASQGTAAYIQSAGRVDACRSGWARIEPCTEHEGSESNLNACSWCGLTGENGGVFITCNENYSGAPAPYSRGVDAGGSITLPAAVNGPANADFMSWNTAADGSGTYYAPGQTVTPEECFTLYAQWAERTMVGYVDENGASQSTEARILTANMSVLPAGWYVASGTATASARIRAQGDVKLILADGCQFTAGAGIDVPMGNSLTVYGQSGLYSVPNESIQTQGTGRLIARTASDQTAAIGSNKGTNAGTITICGGVITASGNWGAGIGGGDTSNCGTVNIINGCITATSTNGSAGIGGGGYGSGGNVNISGGYVYAAGNIYRDSQATPGIGSGRPRTNGTRPPSGGTVNITGGVVIAAAGSLADGVTPAQAIGVNQLSAGVNGNGAPGTLVIGDKMRVTAGDSAETAALVPADDRVNACRSTWARIEPCTEHEGSDSDLDACRWCDGTDTDGVVFVSFNSNLQDVPAAFSYGVEAGGSLTAPMSINGAEGYTLLNWNTAADGSGVSYAPGQSITPQSALTLYAQWRPKTYNVRYFANGGTGDVPESQRATYNVPFALHENNLTRTGYSASGWCTASDGSSITYASGQTVSRLSTGAAVNLYAKWTPNTYDIAFNANGGTGTMDNQQMTYGVYSSLTPNAFTRNGYTFDGWNTAKDGSGTAYPDKRTVRNLVTEGTVTLYAQWTRNTYTILFAANGGTGSATSQKATYNLPIALTANAFTRTGYTFNGWNTEADGSGTQFTDRQTVLNLASTGTVKLYAQWKPKTYTIMFVTNGGSGSTVSQKTSYDLPTELTANTFTRTGYYFYRWNTAADGSGSYYSDGQTVTNLAASGTFKLYAQWKPNKYTVTFDANGGTGTMIDQNMTYNTSAALRANTYTKTGYTFTGWNTKPDGSGTSYANGKTVRNLATDGTVTLYAQWKANTITVRFYPNGGTGSMSNQVMTYDVSAALSANAFYRDGYTFAGWKTGAGATYTDGQVVENLALKGVVNLYAQWTR